MANVKITALTPYGTEHGDDLVPIVDVHDTSMYSSGTDKGATIHKIFGSPSTGQILAWSGTSTGVPVGLSSLTWDGTNIVCAAPFHTQTGTSSEIAAIFKGRSGQSVDLVQVQDSTAAVLASINSVGIYKGPRAFAYASKTGTYVATLADGVIACDATSGAFAVTLPAESTAPLGFELIIEKTDGSANAVTVTAAGSDTINGSATYELSAVYQYVRITADGSGKWIVNGAVSSGGGGTVTSVTFTGDGTVLSSTPSGAVTSSGTVSASLASQPAHYVIAGPTSGSSATLQARALIAADLPAMVASGSSHAAGIVPDPGASSGTTKFLREDATWAVPSGGGGGGGTVTSVTFTGDGTVLSSTPSDPITGSGTLTASLNAQTAHYVLAGPTSAGPSSPTFRALLAGDLPVLGNTAAGIAPNPSGADNTYFLRADATWSVPLGGNQNPNTVFAGPIVTPAAAPSFRSLVYGDLPIMVAAGLSGHAPGAVPDPGATSSGGTKFLCDNATWAVPPGTYTPPGSGPGSGTVTSVGFQGDGVVDSSTISGPITGSGTLVATIKTQAANKVLAGPTSGADAAPTFRSLVAADLPGGPAIIYSQTASVSVTTTNDTSFVNTSGAVGSVVLAAGYLTAGRALRFRFGGYCATASSPGNWKVGVFFGSTCMATTGVQPPPANNATYMPWQGEILLVCTIGGNAGTSNVWSSGAVMIYQSTPVITGFWGVGPASSFGSQSNGAALSPNLSAGITLDLKANSSGVMTFQNWTLTHLIIESLG